MSQHEKPPVGSIGWCDLTVADAAGVRDFYRDVLGWKATEVDMNGYSDYVMQQPKTGAPTAGICWARGKNRDLPPVWLIYFVVKSLDNSLAQLLLHGGTVVREPVSGGGGRFAVVKDPAGAVCALYEAED
ncbi:MAG TPA: VOC family protein [Candidatus Polarisedimenticolaceae bacterium]|nr:VOC family protein [Candidatus Polarisedimenticolaceae bacterium]